VTKTKIDFIGVLIILIVTVLLVSLLSWMSYEWFISEEKLGLAQRVLLTVITVTLTPLVFAVELPKLKTVEIDEEKIVLRNLVTGQRKEILIGDFDGFKTTTQFARGGPVYELILIINGRPFHDISSNYIKNYNEVRTELDKQLENLGTEKFEYFKYIRERLT
jgi:hypothetical protein